MLVERGVKLIDISNKTNSIIMLSVYNFNI